MLDLHGISQAAFDLIVASEVSSKAIYVRKYRYPEWPGQSSGVTIGIGYDVGQNSRAQLRADWTGKLPEAMLKILEKTCGVTGEAAEPLARAMKRNKSVDVPWDVALDVFSNHDVPRYLAMCRAYLPGFDDLPADCKGAILSIVFNRGASFNKAGDRFKEMRAIKACVKSGNLAGIPALIKAMKRLWPNNDGKGLRIRRDAEAALFAKGLASQHASFMSEALEEDTGRPVNDRDPADDTDADDDTAADDTPAADDAEEVEVITDPDVIQRVQVRLKALGYFDIGKPDGDMADRTQDAILALRRRYDLPLRTTIDSEFLAVLAKAQPRPISEARANATADDLRDQGSETLCMTDRFKKWAGRIFGVGSSGSILAVATERLTAVKGFGEAVSGFGLSVRSIVIIAFVFGACLILTGVGLLVWWIADKIERKRVIDYRTAAKT